jgi:fatty-acyl-CoA synthase
VRHDTIADLLLARAGDGHAGRRTGDRVYRRTGRGGPKYTLLTDEDKAALRAEFAANGRQRFLP